MMFAQAIDNIPAGFWKYFCMALLVLLGVAAAAVGIYSSLRKPEAARLNDEPAIKVEKVSKRYNHDANELRLVKIEGQIASNEAEINALWTEMRDTAKEAARVNQEIAVSLAEIKTSMGINVTQKS